MSHRSACPNPTITMEPNQVPVFPIGLPITIMAKDKNPMPA